MQVKFFVHPLATLLHKELDIEGCLGCKVQDGSLSVSGACGLPVQASCVLLGEMYGNLLKACDAGSSPTLSK